MTALTEHAVAIESDRLKLEGASHAPDTPRFAAVVLHPHPQYGGDMDNVVVVEACRALGAAGGTTLRFNFRGTGGSEGRHDRGPGERTDALAAVAWLREQAPDAPLLLVGYSFGAAIAALAVAEAAPVGLVLISPPLSLAELNALPAGLDVLALAGDQDSIVPADRLAALAGPRARAVVVPGVDHSWWSGLDVLRAELVAFAIGLGAAADS